MPDFERVADQMRLDLAKTPEDKMFARGYIAGKNRARKEVAILVAFVPGLLLLALAVAIGRAHFNI